MPCLAAIDETPHRKLPVRCGFADKLGLVFRRNPREQGLIGEPLRCECADPLVHAFRGYPRQQGLIGQPSRCFTGQKFNCGAADKIGLVFCRNLRQTPLICHLFQGRPPNVRVRVTPLRSEEIKEGHLCLSANEEFVGKNSPRAGGAKGNVLHLPPSGSATVSRRPQKPQIVSPLTRNFLIYAQRQMPGAAITTATAPARSSACT